MFVWVAAVRVGPPSCQPGPCCPDLFCACCKLARLATVLQKTNLKWHTLLEVLLASPVSSGDPAQPAYPATHACVYTAHLR